MTPMLNVPYYDGDWLLLELTDDTEQHVVDLAQKRWADAGNPPDADAVTLLATQLLEMTKQIFSYYLHELDILPTVLVYNPIEDPRLTVGPVLIVADFEEALSGGEDELRRLAGADDPDAVEPPDVTWVETPLGAGVRVKRFSREAPEKTRFGRLTPGPVFLALSYAWNLPEPDGAVRLVFSGSDIAEVASLIGAVDKIAQEMSIIEE